MCIYEGQVGKEEVMMKEAIADFLLMDTRANPSFTFVVIFWLTMQLSSAWLLWDQAICHYVTYNKRTSSIPFLCYRNDRSFLRHLIQAFLKSSSKETLQCQRNPI